MPVALGRFVYTDRNIHPKHCSGGGGGGGVSCSQCRGGALQEQGGSRHRECRGQGSEQVEQIRMTDNVGENVLTRLPSSAVCEKSDD